MDGIYVHRANALRDKVFSNLCYHNRHRNRDGAIRTLERPELVQMAGSPQDLALIIRACCVKFLESSESILAHPKTKERFAQWAADMMEY